MLLPCNDTKRDLEAEIDTLRELDTLRMKSARLRDEGIKVLEAEQSLNKDYGPLDFEFLSISLALWELSSDPPKKLKELTEKLKNLELTQIVASPVPILSAAGVLQTLAAAPGFALTKASSYCYYLIIRELYTADAPDWAVGGARGTPKGGTVSAFVTAECVRALLGLAHTFENTSAFIAEVGAIQKRADQLIRMQNSFKELEKFVLVEKERLKFSLYTTSLKFSRRLVFELPELPALSCLNIEEYIKDIALRIGKTAEEAGANFENALVGRHGTSEGIDYFRNEIEKPKEEKPDPNTDEYEKLIRFTRSEPGHFIARSAIRMGQENILRVRELFASSDWYTDFNKWEELKKRVDEVSAQIRALLPPVKNFVSSTLDRELATAVGGSYGGWDVVSMACAAAAYGEVTEEWEDDRLRRVAELLKKVISNHGRFPIGRPSHVPGKDYYVPENTVAMGAVAQILKEVGVRAQRLKHPANISVEPMFVKKLLKFFDETRADKPVDVKGEKKKGWSPDYRPSARLTDPGATARAAHSLALINQMLDEQINAQVLPYFFVKQLDELKRGPDLDSLFYPDYGLRRIDSRFDQKESIAILLQKMCAHVAGR